MYSYTVNIGCFIVILYYIVSIIITKVIKEKHLQYSIGIKILKCKTIYFYLQEMYMFLIITSMVWFSLCFVFPIVMAFYAGQKLLNEITTINRAITKLYSSVFASTYKATSFLFINIINF